MDAIDRAIGQGWHLTNNARLNHQTWKDFEQEVRGKKLFLFGVGKGADYYCYRYKDSLIMEGIIDNDSGIHGYRAEEVIAEEIGKANYDVKISDISVLDQYDRKRIVILITSLKYYNEIAEQLEKRKIYQYFALLPMEANERKRDAAKEYEDHGIDYYVSKSSQYTINEKKIVFLTMSDYAGHGKEIAKQLLLLRSDLDIVWMVDSFKVEVPQGIRLVLKRNQKKYAYEMETAKMWICDTGIPNCFVKREGQIYVQIKHWASITLKAFGFDLARFRNDESQIAFCEYDSRIMDYIITGSKFDELTSRRGFAFEGEVFQAGSPRSDILFRNREELAKVCQAYGLDKNKRYLLYAPTFRSKKGEQYIPEASHIDLDFEMAKESLERRFGGEWIILLRLHPVVASVSKKIRKPEYVIDVSDYHDSEELVAVSDAMITDYSSIMFETAFVKKPVFLFATDRKEYINGERGLLIDYDTLPFSIAESNKELAENIEKFEKDLYEKQIDQFLERNGVHEDGHAGERAAVFVSGLIGS